jgi:Tol biopolymer transport system component
MVRRIPVAGQARTPLAAAGDLPLTPGRRIEFNTSEGSWVSLDVSPDARAIVFELLGDLYVMDAEGGEARRITGSMAFHSQPAYSPDGTLIAFVSDGSGAENVWIARPDGSGPRPITANDSAHEFVSPSWSPDGRSLFVSLYRSDRNALELWRYPLEGEAPAQRLTGDGANGVGAVASPDGRWLYYAACEGPIFEDEVTLPRWRIDRLELATGLTESVVTNQGSAMRPRFSPDGKTLAYAARFAGQTGLRLRDLERGDDRWIAWPVEHDVQEALPTRDLVPGFAFAPDGRALFAAWGGKIKRLELASGEATVVPFSAHVARDIGPSLRLALKNETGPVRARIISDPAPSPEGGRLVFSALGKVHVMDLDGGAPRALAEGGPPQFMPSWSPCGRFVVYVTWTADEAGHVWLAPADGSGAPRRLTKIAAFYTHPTCAPDGATVLVLRSNHYERLHTYMEPVFTGRAFGALRQAELLELAWDAEAERVVTSGMMSGQPQFTDKAGVAFMLFDDGLNEVSLDASGRRCVLQVVGPGYYFLEAPQPADDLKISPDRRWVLAQHVQQLHLIAMPPPGAQARPIDLSAPGVAHRRLTRVGADFCGWADGGRTITWALGARFHRRALESVAPAAPGERTIPGDHGVETVVAVVEAPRDAPSGALVLRGAVAITMRGEEVIEGADIVVAAGRIVGVGKAGEVAIPTGAQIRDISGAFVTPGLIDSHAHWACVRRGVLDFRNWCLEASLAYGVTAGLDPSTLTIDLLAYQDLQEAGLTVGPRIYSTGVAVFSFNSFESLDQTRDGLSRYVEDYRTQNLKQYRTGNRRVRQWVAMAAHELGLMPTTEGALDMKLDLTQVIDGFAGNEHSLSPAPIYDDVVQLLVRARASYVLTLQCTHGGPPAMNASVQAARPLGDAKLARFFPPFMLERLFARGAWADAREQVFQEVAASAARLVRAEGLVGIGSHGNVAGLGLHWELQAHVAGGFSPHEALRAGTMGSAETIGRQLELGSLEPGKYADLIILDRDPREDIRNTLAIRQVMQNGRLYEAETLDEVWPRRRPRARPWFADDHPPSYRPPGRS